MEKYYKDTEGNVYVYNDIQTPKAGLVVLTTEEVEAHLNPKPTTEQLAEQARASRDQLLSASDFSQLPDAPVDAQAWAVYRQALRDVPEQSGFPETIVWPEKP